MKWRAVPRSYTLFNIGAQRDRLFFRDNART